MYGYDHVTDTFLSAAQVTMGGYNEEQKGELALKNTLCTMVSTSACITPSSPLQIWIF